MKRVLAYILPLIFFLSFSLLRAAEPLDAFEPDAELLLCANAAADGPAFDHLSGPLNRASRVKLALKSPNQSLAAPHGPKVRPTILDPTHARTFFKPNVYQQISVYRL